MVGLPHCLDDTERVGDGVGHHTSCEPDDSVPGQLLVRLLVGGDNF